MPESLKVLNRPRGYDRRRAVEELKNGKIKVVFTVGMFNEGRVDIPSVDSILLLRPTESYVISCSSLDEDFASIQGREQYWYWILSVTTNGLIISLAASRTRKPSLANRGDY